MKVIDLILIEAVEYSVYIDLDGVLADFDKGASKLLGEPYSERMFENNKQYTKRMWDKVAEYSKRGGELWYNLDLMHDARDLWNYVKKYEPQILSATGRTVQEHTADQKRRWVAEKFGKEVKVNLTETAHEKSKFAKPNRVLIDDKTKAINPWESAGGIGILHTSANTTITELKKLGL